MKPTDGECVFFYGGKMAWRRGADCAGGEVGRRGGWDGSSGAQKRAGKKA